MTYRLDSEKRLLRYLLYTLTEHLQRENNYTARLVTYIRKNGHITTVVNCVVRLLGRGPRI